MDCTPTTVFTPTNDTPLECPEGLLSTNCISSPSAIVYLGLGANVTQTQINTALVLALIAKDQRIDALEARIVILEP